VVHEQVGHLGIFVSSKVAQREHTEVESTLRTIEALAPGLYEMKIDDFRGEGVERTFTVSLHERTFDDLRALSDGSEDGFAFAAVARTSELQAQAYDILLRPVVRAACNPMTGELSRTFHPLRLQRALASSRNPAMGLLTPLADQARANRRPAEKDNPFIEFESIWADSVEQAIDFYRDVRDAWYEIAFLSVWGSPWAYWFGHTHQQQRTLKDETELRALGEVQSALQRISEGGFPEAVIRMLVLLVESRRSVRRDRLERSALVLTEDEPFRSLTAEQRKRIIDEQTLIVQFEPKRALATLPDLLKTPEEREVAARVAQYIPGAISEMAPRTLETLQSIRQVLNLPPVSEDILKDPLSDANRGAVVSVAAE
jgi:hypothetical protein